MRRALISIAVVAVVIVAAGASAQQADGKLVGTLLILNPTSMQVATDGGPIERLAIVETSDVGPAVVEGDRIEVWYEADREGNKTVQSAHPGTAQPASTRSRSQSTASGPAAATTSSGRSMDPQGTKNDESASGTTWENDYGLERRSYRDVVSVDLDPGEHLLYGMGRLPVELPQTGSVTPRIGLAGVAALLAAAALGVLRSRLRPGVGRRLAVAARGPRSEPWAR